MVTGTELDELIVADGAALRAWLLDNHAASPGVWLALTRKGGSVTALTWQQAVDEALCFGWIDGQARKRDEESSWRRLTPRRPRSVWSRRNVDNVARLEAAGLMLPAGRAAVDAAKADGRWTAAYAPSSELEAPADLLAAIAEVPAAQAMFEVLTRTNRFALVNRVNAVKRAETRTRKISEFVAMLARHETPHPQRAKPADPPTS
ncbi:YdeI/OmpD-associated family protein [Kitasatospora purpeofusca]|uniref:YdeI/OmpD-associated family protein n=1 Tax=Kitasatospora purpeofusca TaxID=67352 RepID=UPI0035DC482F